MLMQTFLIVLCKQISFKVHVADDINKSIQYRFRRIRDLCPTIDKIEACSHSANKKLRMQFMYWDSFVNWSVTVRKDLWDRVHTKESEHLSSICCFLLSLLESVFDWIMLFCTSALLARTEVSNELNLRETWKSWYILNFKSFSCF